MLPSRHLLGKADAIPRICRQIGDKIDTQISWPCKHFLNFFASKIVLRVVVSLVSLNRFLQGTAGFSSWRRNGLVWSLRHFYVFVSSGLPFVDCATYLTAVSRHLKNKMTTTRVEKKEMSEFSKQLSPSYNLKNHLFSAVSEVIRLLENFR